MGHQDVSFAMGTQLESAGSRSRTQLSYTLKGSFLVRVQEVSLLWFSQVETREEGKRVRKEKGGWQNGFLWVPRASSLVQNYWEWQ